MTVQRVLCLIRLDLTFLNQSKEPKTKRRKKSTFSKSAFAVDATELAEEATFADIQRDEEQADEIEEIVRDSDIGNDDIYDDMPEVEEIPEVHESD